MTERPWWSIGLQWAVWLIVMGLVMGWVSRSRSRRKSADPGHMELPTSYGVIAVICTLVFATITILFSRYRKPDQDDFRIGFVFIGFCALGAVMTYHYVI